MWAYFLSNVRGNRPPQSTCFLFCEVKKKRKFSPVRLKKKNQRKFSPGYNYFCLIGYIVIRASTAKVINCIANDFLCLSNNLNILFDNYLFIPWIKIGNNIGISLKPILDIQFGGGEIDWSTKSPYKDVSIIRNSLESTCLSH